MPPEQMRARAQPDARADVYSLGVVLYELLSLQLPYRGADALAIMRAAEDARPDSIRARNRRVPPDLETVCLVAMEAEPSRRYASAAAFSRDLANVLAHRPIEARPPGAWVRARRLAQRHPARAAALLLGFLLVVGVPLALLAQQRAHAKDLEQSLSLVREANRLKDVALAQERESALDMDSSLTFVTDLFLRAAPLYLQCSKPGRS
jgi:serine/threonine-protein kinase